MTARPPLGNSPLLHVEFQIFGDVEYFPTPFGRVKSLGYGTVIRTELYAAGSESDRVGFAIRFDVPQLIDL